MDPFTVCILSYYKPRRLKACIDSILPLLRKSKDRLIIVENSVNKYGDIHTETRALVQWYEGSHHGLVGAIYNDENNEFSKGANQGLSLARTEYFFLVNNDTEVTDPDTFRKMIEFAKSREKVATVTPVTLQSNGSVYCSGAFGSGAHHKDIPTEPRQSEWNNFAFVLIKKSIVSKVGYLDIGMKEYRGKRTFIGLYHSDEMFCRRCTASGYQHWVVPVKVMHYHKEGD